MLKEKLLEESELQAEELAEEMVAALQGHPLHMITSYYGKEFQHYHTEYFSFW